MGKKKMKYHFRGFATRFNVKCSDGRTIKPDAFKHNDGMKVPLMWQHGHNDPFNVVGYGILEHQDKGMYVYGMFNETEQGKHAKALVEHGDVSALSIFANGLKQNMNDVIHGNIREVSLVLAGANPGAYIEHVELAHGDGADTTAAVVFMDIEHSALDGTAGEIEVEEKEVDTDELSHADDKTLGDVMKTFNDEQKTALYTIISQITEDDEMQQSDNDDETLEHFEQGGNDQMKRNIFDGTGTSGAGGLKHGDIKAIIEDARNNKRSLREATVDYIKHNDELCKSFLAHTGLESMDGMMASSESLSHAAQYGIDNIDYLFPEFKNLDATPQFDKRDDGWVGPFLSGVSKRPFSKIRTRYADLTADEARARGYVKGDEKIEEVIKILQRETSATMIYKKQKLNRQDIIEITDFDVVMWLKMEMRMMLDEERARAYLVGDGRSVLDKSKISEDHIRPIYTDDDIFCHKVSLDTLVTGLDELEEIMSSKEHYKGTGVPNLYTTSAKVIAWKKLKNKNDDYYFRTKQEIADFLGVKSIIEVEVMEGVSRDHDSKTWDLLAIMVNPRDYTVGANRGGKVSMFNQFDIDFNQEKYLMEAMECGALTKIRSAVTIEKEQPAG